jgi:branched-chain amino acid transport system substrate-binding protein
MGISIPMTGAGFNAVGRQLAAAIKLYVEQHGDAVAGRKIGVILRDDAGVADNARRIVQEMIVNEKVGLIGIGITPTSLAIAPLVTEARIPTLVLSSGASVTVTKSPYMVRAGFVIAQQSWIMAEWAAKNGSKRVVTLVNDWATGIEAEIAFKTHFIQAGGRSSSRFASRSLIRILPPSCSGYAISIRIRRSFISPARKPAFLPNSSPSAVWPTRASRSLGPAI